MMPSVTELTYFYEVSKTLNVTRAAKNLSISQPALTRAIQNLEKTIGTELFIRHKNGVVMTRAGKKVLLHVKPLIEHWKNTKIEAVSAHSRIEGLVKIGCHSTIGLFIHGFIKELTAKYSELDIEVHTAVSTQITQQVIDLNIDIGIVATPIQYPDLIIRKIDETETSLWVGTGNQPSQNIHSGEAIIICNPDFHHTPHILQKCKSANIQFKRLLKVNSIEVIASLTANGCGIGILPEYFAKTLYKNKLARVPKAPFFTDPLYLIYRKEYLNVQVIKTVINAIKDWVKANQ